LNKVIIIGSGIAGIASSIRLAKNGYSVKVFESNSFCGGKLHAFEKSGYRFDAGPSLFTMPNYVDELFDLFGENSKEYFSYKKKDISCNYFWEDGTRLCAFSDKKKFANEVKNKLGVPTHRLLKYLKKAEKKYNLTKTIFLEKSLHKLSTFLTTDTLKAIASLNLFQITKSLNDVNEKELINPYLIQLYNRFATYNGSSPYKTPGMMTLIQHLEQEYGTFLVEKGMVDIVNSLFNLAKRKGVVFKFNKNVSQILVENKKAIGVHVDSKKYYANYVISNMDVVPTYNKLLKGQKKPNIVLNQERSSSAVIFYWGIKKEFPSLDLHNIFFSNNYKKEFNSIFNEKEIYEDPTIYINITSKDIPNDAPKNCENWFVMINSPNNENQDWEKIVTNTRKNVIKKINKILNTDIECLIEKERVYTPKDIESTSQSYLGSLYGASSNSKMSAFLRHPNFSKNILNLYFCGGSVHPGGGIPLCLLSAKIVSNLIE
jgi:phytoene desaturase